ncbi:hypothetical protein ABEB36_012659 [Hypothenemus hampei]|uniref:Uncharacterized protein n=1 Tax=Hypothenemus hampei TaxID=57062 RepID=A0ABD1EBZ3_HYPHA
MKMILLNLLISVFWANLLVKCEEAHHIEHRILQDEENGKTDDNFLDLNNTLWYNTTNASSTVSPISTTTFNVSILLRSDNSSDQLSVHLNNNATDTEVADLLNRTEINEQQLQISHQHPLDPEQPEHFSDKITNQETELIDDGKNTEDELRSQKQEFFEDETSHGPVAVVLAIMFVTLSIVCYAALLIWRKYLEKRYGSRTLLVEAEEIDPSDLKNFSI